MSVLEGFRVLQIGSGLAAAVCGRLFADVGASVTRIDPDLSTPLAEHLNGGLNGDDTIASADLIVSEGSPLTLRQTGRDPDVLRLANPKAVLVLISPYGQTGPRAEEPATDLTLHFASGIARMLTGQVDDLNEPPMRPIGEQSAFLGGLAAACAGMHAALLKDGSVIDVSIHEALATIAITELARAGQTGASWSRKRVADGNGATVCILPARDGYAAISPREDRQWASWLEAMGLPAWGREARFATKKDRVANWDALHALMSDWSRKHDKRWIAATAQAAHVSSFPLCEPAEHLQSEQLRHRAFFRPVVVSGQTVRVPGSPFGVTEYPMPSIADGDGPAVTVAVTGTSGIVAELGATPLPFVPASRSVVHASQPGLARPPTTLAEVVSLGASAGSLSDEETEANRDKHAAGLTPGGPLPLSGIRVLDFSWVIAGPTATRYLAAMGADVIKIEAPGRGDPGRASELHSVLGQAKKAIVLDLKKPEAIEIAKALAANADVLVENFATGVMDRLGLGAEALRAINPRLIYVSASGLGRTGPQSHAVAYGTLLQCYAGFAGLNRHPDRAPRVGMAWLDPMCGLMLAFITGATVWRRRSGVVARVDFSMIEAMLWTMADPLLAEQLPEGRRRPERDAVYRCAGLDDWVAIDPAPVESPSPDDALKAFIRAGVALSPLARSADLVDSVHLQARGFWDGHGTGVVPGLPWRASFGRTNGPAPELGANTDMVLRTVLGLSAEEIGRLRDGGALF